MKFLCIFINSVVLWVACYGIGKMLFEEKARSNYLKLIPTVIILSLIVAHMNYVDSGGIMKIVCMYSLFCLFYKIIFEKELSKVLVASLILYLFLCASEVVMIIIAGVFLEIINEPMTVMKNSVIMNFLIIAFEYIIIYTLKNKMVPFVSNNNLGKKSGIIVIFIILITLALLGFKIPLSNWKFNPEFIITMNILLSFCFIGVIMIKQNSDIQKTKAMYQNLADYSDITNNLLEDYRLVSHERKNQLLVIRSMLDNSNKELVDYVDSLLDKNVGFKYEWIGELNRLPLSGLKGLINYKLVEANSSNINTNISISKEVTKSKLNKLSTKQKDALYSIMGVYIDNAIQAATNSKDKEISLEIYKEKRKIIIILANTYSGKIELEKLDDYGYTTKGKNHGVGLHLVKRILESEDIYSQSRELFDKYYVQKLIINLEEL